MLQQVAGERGSVVWLLAYLGAVARRRMDTLLTALALSPPEARLLLEVARTADATVLGLAEGCGLGGSTAVAAIDGLEHMELAQRERDRGDRRVVRVRLTERGREVAARLPAMAAGLEDELTEGFSAEERETLRGYLTRLVEAVAARSPEIVEKLRAERLAEWEREALPSARGRGRRSR